MQRAIEVTSSHAHTNGKLAVLVEEQCETSCKITNASRKKHVGLGPDRLCEPGWGDWTPLWPETGFPRTAEAASCPPTLGRLRGWSHRSGTGHDPQVQAELVWDFAWVAAGCRAPSAAIRPSCLHSPRKSDTMGWKCNQLSPLTKPLATRGVRGQRQLPGRPFGLAPPASCRCTHAAARPSVSLSQRSDE